MFCQETRQARKFFQDVADVALGGPDIEKGRADREYVVDLARVHDSPEWSAHHYDVHIGRGETGAKFGQRLVGQAQDVGQRILAGKCLNASELTTAADEAELDMVVAFQSLSSL